MARMVPSPMRPTPSTAESYLYTKFERELAPEVTVVHGARWVGIRQGRRGEDGEADFVILHPRDGILVLEAKSGTVRRDGERGTWLLAAGGREEEIRDPVAQAHDSKHALRALLGGMPGVASRRLHLVHGLALPFQTVPPEGLGPDIPRARILDATALGDLGGFVRRALASADARGAGRPDLGADGVARVADALVPSRTLRWHLPRLAEAVHERVVEATQEQFDVLDGLALASRAWVSGGPGTGKTVLAQELARRLAVQGKKVLLVCFNGPLAGRLGAFAEGIGGLTATTFHELCRRRAREAGLADDLEAAAPSPDVYDSALPDLLLRAADRLTDRYDAIVVDEAQDFRSLWWIALEAWLRGGHEGLLYAFCDESQDLYRRAEPFPPPGLDLRGPLHLSTNCRNPDEIQAVLSALSPPGSAPRPGGVRSERRPRLTWVASRDAAPAAASAAVERLLGERLPPGEIVVLTPRSRPRSVLGRLDRLGRAPFSWRDRASPGHVLVDTIHRFKGLEATAVVLVEIDPEDVRDLGRLVLVGVSRALVSLDVVASRSAHDLLAPALPHFDEFAGGGPA